MRAWETILVAVITVDVETANSVHTLEFLKSIERHLTSTRNELQKLGAFFLIERADSAPEPLNLGRGGRVVMILGIDLPIIHFNFGETGD
jgi:hypothetical protein